MSLRTMLAAQTLPVSLRAMNTTILPPMTLGASAARAFL
jgi:hypothetical protein